MPGLFYKKACLGILVTVFGIRELRRHGGLGDALGFGERS